MSDEFDWDDLSQGERVVNPARETAVYLNSRGDVVIRQRQQWPDENEDPYLLIPLHRVPALINQLDKLLMQAHDQGLMT